MAKPRGFDSGFGAGFGVGRYRYVLTPYVWDTTTGPGSYWRLPDSSVGGVDLRPLAAQALAGGAPQGFAFAAAMQPVDGVEIARVLHFGQEPTTTAHRDAWQAGTGFRPDGATLVDLLWDQLTTGSDPDGIAGPKPLMPGVGGQLKLFVGGHSLVKWERLRWGHHPHTGKVRDLLRRQFREQWEATNGDDHCRRCLDYTCRKYRVEDWREFVPPNLHAHVPGRLPHRTTITESFNQGDSTTVGPDLSWTELAGGWATVSNALAKDSGGDSDDQIRADSDLSSDDHYAQVVVLTTTTVYPGGVARMPGTATQTGYTHRFSDATGTHYLQKIVAGAITTLDTLASAGHSANDVAKVEADGSTIRGFKNGSEETNATDTAIVGNVRCGCWQYGQQPAGQMDSFEAADLAAGGGSILPLVAVDMANIADMRGMRG